MGLLGESRLGDRKVIVRELTVEEIRTWCESAAGRSSFHLVDSLFEDLDISISDIPSFSDLTAAELEGHGPSEFEPLIAKIREVNPRFFATWRRRLELIAGGIAPHPDLQKTLPD
ncbi:MAG: hypothetical protein D3M94_07415 [Rhodocyclales bacterium GT-UBC]|nr:MAG: hypothetical protein D3M94_07415 [Rhodocyclales bacterium GT-UBC]